MNSFKNRPEMTRMARHLEENPDYYLVDDNGNRVKDSQGLYASDLSKPEVHKWWLNTCLNATKYASGDGCYCNSSTKENTSSFTPSPSADKLKSWGEGMLNLTHEVQEALGDYKLLVGKVANQSCVKAVQIDGFKPINRSILALMLGAQVGQVVQVHVPAKSDLTDYMAAFLIGAGEYSYFGCGSWNSEGNDTTSLTWYPE